MSEIKELKRFIYSATVTRGSGSQSFYIDAESREEADKRAANNESDGMYADDSEVTDLDALEYEDKTTVDDFGDFPLISREQSLIAQLEAAQKERDELKMKLSDAGCLLVEWKQRVEKAENERDLLAVQLKIATERSGINFDRAQKAEAALSVAQLDATRWRALLSSPAIRILGHAGLQDDKPIDGHYCHFGMEIWSHYEPYYDNKKAGEVITRYADNMIAASLVEGNADAE
ncbi:TPA: hypothetical protein PXN08_003989 [Yersinia enterocolitica]|nr:hypothetical protein [Yersinia enterocolitica]HDL7355826.1 hypothetical protein [Yersinia enterocolitica]